jgi:sugar lactone lactonase YvrE
MPTLATSRFVNAYGRSQIPTQLELTSEAGTTDGYIVRYNTSGKAIWSARIMSPTAGVTTIFGVTTDANENVIITGQTGSGTRTTLYNSDGSPSGLFTTGNAGANDAFIAKYHNSGKALWIARVGGVGTEFGFGVSTDSSGNIYFVGTQGAAAATAFNADGTAFGTTLPLRATSEAMIVKYDPNGNVLFVAQIGSATASSSDLGTGIVVNKSTGDFYVIGTAVGNPTTAYNSDLTAFATTIIPTGGGDAYIAKYDTNGFVQWFTSVSSPGPDNGNAIAIDSNGDIYALCYTLALNTQTTIAYNADGTAFPTQPAGLATTTATRGDAVLVKYDSSGFVQWVTLMGNNQVETTSVVVADSSGNVYMAHRNEGTGLFQGDIFLRKLNATTGAVIWSARMDSDASDVPWGLVTDSNGDIYISVMAGSSVPFRIKNVAGTPIFSVTNTGGTNDAYLIKYNSSGTPLWVRRLASANNDTNRGLAIGNSNDLYVTGQFTARPAALYGQTLSYFSTIPNSGGEDAFIVKYNSNGAPQWTARVASATTGADFAYGTSTDSEGNIYVVGESGASSVITAYNADGSAFGTTFTSVGDDVFIVKYDPYGTVQWMTYISSTGTDIGYAVATDPSGNLYITGSGGSATLTAYSVGDIAFSPALSNAGNGDAFIVKYNSSGVVQWNARISSTQVDIGYGIATDSSGNVYVTGQTGSGQTVSVRNSDDTVFGTLTSLGGTDAYVAKYDTNGTVQWIARIGSTGGDIGRSIFSDSSGNVYIAVQGGAATVTAYQGGDGTGASFGLVPNAGLGEVVIVKYNTNGLGQWITRCYSSAADVPYGITTDIFGNVYIAGAAGNTTFTALSANGTAHPLTLPGGGLRDAFLVKYDSSGNVKWLSRIASGTDDIIYGIACDKVGNVYVAGWFGSSVGGDTFIFNPDGLEITRVRESLAVAKFNTNGYFQWAVPLRSVLTTGTLSPGSAIARSIACDYYGNITVVGSSASGRAIYVYGSDRTVYKLLYVPRGTAAGPTTDGALIKYSAMGIPQWGSIICGAATSNELLYDVTTDSSGNIYASGVYGSGAMILVNGDGTIFIPGLAISGTRDGIILKYNPSGIIQWRARIFSTNDEFGLGLAVDSSGNVYASGQVGSSTTTTFWNANDTATAAPLTSEGSADAFIAKYDTSGTVLWRVKIASTIGDAGWSCAVDSSGNVYASGIAGAAGFYNADDTLAGSMTNTGLGDAFLVKYDTNGTFQWAAKLGSTAADFGYDIAVDSSGNVYMTGGTNAGGTTMTVTNADGSTGGSLTPISGSADCFVIKFNSSGIQQWFTRIAGRNNNDVGRSIAVDPSGNVFVSGQVFGNPSVTFYQADGTTAFLTIGTAGNVGGFLIKYDTNGNPQWVGQVDTITSTSTSDIAYACTTDSSGNAYVSIDCSPFTIFAYNGDRSLFGSTMTGPTNGTNVALVKYSSTGQVQWLTSLGTHGNNGSRGLAVDSSGNILMAGAITSTAFLPESS